MCKIRTPRYSNERLSDPGKRQIYVADEREAGDGRREMGDGGVLDDCGQQKDKTKGLGQKIEIRVLRSGQASCSSGGAAAKETMDVDYGCGCGCGMDRQKNGTKNRLTAEMDCQPSDSHTSTAHPTTVGTRLPPTPLDSYLPR